jgi:hypothetical protein
VIPTGQRQCPSLGQCLSASLAYRIESEFDGQCRVFAYIDNIAIFARNEQVLGNATALLNILCSDANITLNTDAVVNRKQFDFLGVRWSLKQPGGHASCFLTEKTKAKLADASRTIAEADTPRQLLRIFGIFVFASRGRTLHQIYPTLKFLRRIGKIGIDEKISVWPCAFENMR